MNKVIKLLLTATLVTTTGLAKSAMTGAYVGGGAGYSGSDPFENTRVIANDGLGGRLFLGYTFNKFFGVEAAYTALAKNTFTLDNEPNITFNDKLYALGLVGKLYLPLAPESPVSVYGALGLAQINSSVSAQYRSISIPMPDYTTSSLTGSGGFGASYDINQHVIASIDATVFASTDGDDTHLPTPPCGLISLNLSYKF